MYIIPRIYQLKTYYNHVMALLDLSGMTRVSRYQKGKTRKVKPIWISGARDNEWQWHLLGHMQCLLPLTFCKVSPAGETWVHLIPHSTHLQSSSLHGAVKAGSHSKIEKRAIPPPCFPSFNFQSTRSQGAMLVLLPPVLM